jgi:NADP-dependent 3-hydroxy acid dehydrogenase YdfG
MIERGRGHIVSVCSVAGHRGFAGGAAYVASKHGLRGFHECLMLEAREFGVRCTLISPGSVDTAFFPPQKERGWMLRPEDVADAVAYALDADGNALVDEVLVRPLSPPRAK